MQMLPHGSIPSVLNAVRDRLAEAARTVHDGWDQVDGYDEDYGTGGICQDVATAMCEALTASGIEDCQSVHASVGENHVFVVALLPEDGIYMIDIPPLVYEIGSGYTWRKRVGAIIDADDVSIVRIDDAMEADAFHAAYED